MPAVRLEHPMREQQTEENKGEANVGNEHQKQNPVPLMYWTHWHVTSHYLEIVLQK